MKIIPASFIVLLAIAGCAKSPEAVALEDTRNSITSLEYDVSRCNELERKRTIESGERAKAEWDQAAAANITDISPEQEAEIRASLSSELNIPPSKIDWKGIYRRRAEQAKAASASPAADEFLAECKDYNAQQSRLSQLRDREEDLVAKAR